VDETLAYPSAISKLVGELQMGKTAFLAKELNMSDIDQTHLSRRLGLVGGFGVGAAIYYYQELAKAHDARGLTMNLVMVHADITKARRQVEADDRAGLAEYLANLIRPLEAAGAEVAAIAAVTPHTCLEELTARSPLPLVDPLHCTREGIGNQRVALFGTRFTIESDMFGALKGLDVVRPRPEEILYLNDTYFQIASSGTVSDEQRAGLTTLAYTLLQRDKLDAIVIAGTDLSPHFRESTREFPLIDCSRLHVDAIMRSLHPVMTSGTPAPAD
jgi:aspartate racemase